jgi:hypothetical protein
LNFGGRLMATTSVRSFAPMMLRKRTFESTMRPQLWLLLYRREEVEPCDSF